MRHLRLIGLAGVALAGLVLAASMGSRPTLRAQQPPAAISTAFVGGGFGGAEEPPRRTRSAILPVNIAETRTRLKLHEKLPMDFPNATTLEEVLKYVREKTVDQAEFPDGLSLYVDPLGLQDADKTMASAVAIELKGMPLATTLKLAPGQIGMAYWINPDGLIIITNEDSEDIPDGAGNPIFEKLVEIRRELATLRAEVRGQRGLPPAGGGMGGGQQAAPGQMGAAGGFR